MQDAGAGAVFLAQMRVIGISEKYEFSTLSRDREASKFHLHGTAKCRIMHSSPEVVGTVEAHERQQKE